MLKGDHIILGQNQGKMYLNILAIGPNPFPLFPNHPLNSHYKKKALE